MIPKSFRSFIAKLRQATDDGDIKWDDGAPDAYYCNHGAFQIHLTIRFDSEREESSFYFRLKSGDRETYFSVTDNEADYADMKNLFESAGVRASGFENIEDEFFGSGSGP